jgi:hypothetical protein
LLHARARFDRPLALNLKTQQMAKGGKKGSEKAAADKKPQEEVKTAPAPAKKPEPEVPEKKGKGGKKK